MHGVTWQLPAASGQVLTGSGCVLWIAVRESSGSAPASFSLIDGTNANGPRLMPVSLLAGQSAREMMRPHHVPFYTGLFYVLEAGANVGNITVLLDHACGDHWRRKAALIAAELAQVIG